LTDTRIFASGDLDEYSITRLLEAGARIDAFGVGTALSTSVDCPALGGVYKLVQIEKDGRALPVVKLSSSKQTLAGPKQVWRIVEEGSASKRGVLSAITLASRMRKDRQEGGRYYSRSCARGGALRVRSR
jgi:nicotinate phosphoribosyltransferase